MRQLPQGHVQWTELNSWEPEKSAEFLTNVLGWRIEEVPMEDGLYRIGRIGEAMVGGIFHMTEPDFAGLPNHWMTYFAVDDVDASCAAVKANGGAVAREPFDVPGVGRFAIIQDPTGAASGYVTYSG